MAGLSFSEHQLFRNFHRRDLLQVIVSNPFACEGIQFPTDHLNDPCLSSV